MARWIMAERPPRQGRAAVVGTTIMLLIGIAMGMVVGTGLARLVEAAHLEDLAKQFRDPAATAPADVGTLHL